MSTDGWGFLSITILKQLVEITEDFSISEFPQLRVWTIFSSYSITPTCSNWHGVSPILSGNTLFDISASWFVFIGLSFHPYYLFTMHCLIYWIQRLISETLIPYFLFTWVLLGSGTSCLYLLIIFHILAPLNFYLDVNDIKNRNHNRPSSHIWGPTTLLFMSTDGKSILGNQSLMPQSLATSLTVLFLYTSCHSICQSWWLYLVITFRNWYFLLLLV